MFAPETLQGVYKTHAIHFLKLNILISYSSTHPEEQIALNVKASASTSTHVPFVTLPPLPPRLPPTHLRRTHLEGVRSIHPLGRVTRGQGKVGMVVDMEVGSVSGQEKDRRAPLTNT